MKEMRNIADRGGKHHDPMHGPPGTWVYGLEGVGRTVGGGEEMPEATNARKNFQGRERPRFVRPLSRHKPASFGEPCFFAFDLLMADGKDLRSERLTDRKQELRRLMLKAPTSRLRYADHVEQHGTALFRRVCEMDLEGIVAKHGLAPYTTERTTWFKIKNPKYSQMEGREELFERERHKEPVAGWHSCELACVEVEQ